MQELTSLLDKVIQIVGEVASIIKDAPFSTEEKTEATNIVTTNDLLSQKYLMEKLSVILPGSGFYCEEEGVCDCDKEYVWIIDPIDGTTNYSRGIADCGISVALLHNKKAVLGVVRSIFNNDVYYAIRGKGAYYNGKPICVSQNPFNRSILCTAMSLYKKEHAKVCDNIIYETYMQCNDVRRFGSCAMELCYIATGRCELYFEIRVFPWDYAAGYLILSEAGGIVRGLGDEELTFDRPSVVVGANTKENYGKLTQIINKHLKNTPYQE